MKKKTRGNIRDKKGGRLPRVSFPSVTRGDGEGSFPPFDHLCDQLRIKDDRLKDPITHVVD